MSELRKAAQQALEALEGFVYHGIGPNSGPALASLRAALAQPEPFQPDWDRVEALEASLREPLTDEKIDELSRTMVKGDRSVNWLCRAIERAHGIR